MAHRADARLMYEAAERFRDRCVGEGRSFLWPGEHAWTPETIDSLLEAFTGENADTGDRTFVQKWEDQLADEPETVHRVAADVMAFYFLFPSNVSRSKKLQVVREVIGWKLQSDAPDLAFLEQAYSASVGHGGMLYNTRRPEQVMFYLEFARDLLSSRKKPTDLEACKSLADKVKKRLKASNPARNILLHLLFPDHFERIASDGDKLKIVEAFRDRTGRTDDIDDALLNIRRSLAREYKREDIDFYDEDIRPLWQDGSPPPPPPPPAFEIRPLNRILYGPPGTGKTYSVQREAVRVLDPEAAELPGGEVARLYREYRSQGRIEFVTFHPSYSYEEFVEGFRYDEDAKIPIRKDGVFRLLADRASNPRSSPTRRREPGSGRSLWVEAPNHTSSTGLLKKAKSPSAGWQARTSKSTDGKVLLNCSQSTDRATPPTA